MPLHLEKGALKPASTDGPLSDAVPTSCGDGPPIARRDPIREQIIAVVQGDLRLELPDARSRTPSRARPIPSCTC